MLYFARVFKFAIPNIHKAIALWVISGAIGLPSTTALAKIRALNSKLIQSVIADRQSHPENWESADGRSSIILDGRVRVDLVIEDFIDQLEEITGKKRFSKYRKIIKDLIQKEPLENFEKVIGYLESIKKTKKDADFTRVLDHRLIVQNYNIYGMAIPFKTHVFDFQQLVKLDRNSRIEAFNKIIYSPLGPEFIQKFRLPLTETRWTPLYTIQKISLSDRIAVAEKLGTFGEHTIELLNAARKRSTDPMVEGIKVKLSNKTEGFLYRPIKGQANAHVRNNIIPILNAIETVPYREDIMLFLDHELAIQDPKTHIEVVEDQYILTPEFVNAHFDAIVPLLRDYTYRNLLLNEHNDDLILDFRHWVRKNYTDIKLRLEKYNESHSDVPLTLNYSGKGIVHRYQVFADFATLEKLYPNSPWMDRFKPVGVGINGFDLLVETSRFANFMHNVGKIAKDVVRPKNIASAVANLGVTFLSGNAMLGAAAAVIVRESLDTIINNRTFVEGFKDAPIKMGESLVMASPWASGHLVRLFATGAVAGALQSIATGQNVFYGALVGGGFGVAESVLPENVAHPGPKLTVSDLNNGTKEFASIAASVSSFAVKRSAQGAVVAGLSKENVAVGAAKGAAYGIAEGSFLYIFFGRPYRLSDIYTDAELTSLLAAENEYQNTFGLGTYNITVDQMKDATWRSGGIIAQNNGPTATTLGNTIIQNKQLNGNLDITVHEAHHLAQQNYYGYLGMYTRYLSEVPECSFWAAQSVSHTGCNPFEHYRDLEWYSPATVADPGTSLGAVPGPNPYVVVIPIGGEAAIHDGVKQNEVPVKPVGFVFGHNPLMINSK